MSVELLRRAAADMRALAQAATPGPWWAAVGQGPKRRNQQVALVGRADMRGQGEKGCIAVLAGPNGRRADDAEHMAAWYPAVALAVADLLDLVATRHQPEDRGSVKTPEVWCAHDDVWWPCDHVTQALAIATAYLGDDT